MLRATALRNGGTCLEDNFPRKHYFPWKIIFTTSCSPLQAHVRNIPISSSKTPETRRIETLQQMKS